MCVTLFLLHKYFYGADKITSRSDNSRYLELALSCFSIVHLARQRAIGELVEKRASSSWKLKIDVAHFAVTHRNAGRTVVHIYAFRNLTQISNEYKRRIRLYCHRCRSHLPNEAQRRAPVERSPPRFTHDDSRKRFCHKRTRVLSAQKHRCVNWDFENNTDYLNKLF